MEIREIMQEITQLQNSELLDKLEMAASIRQFQKGDDILRIGEMQTKMYLLLDGIVRGYFLNGENLEHALGTAVVTAELENGKAASCEVTVKTVPTLTADEETVQMAQGRFDVYYTFTPEESGYYAIYSDGPECEMVTGNAVDQARAFMWNGVYGDRTYFYVSYSYLNAGETYLYQQKSLVNKNLEIHCVIEKADLCGTCGEGVSWRLEHGVMTISGEGAMHDYGFDDATEWDFVGQFIERVVVEEGVTHLSKSAFDEFFPITSIQLPSTLKSIGSSAFQNCLKLTTAVVPEGVVSITGLFYGCLNLTEVTLPESLVSIGEYSFAETGLTSIRIPSNVKYIGLNVFTLSAIETVIFTGDAPEFDECAFGGFTTTCYYPAGNETWTEAVLQDYDGTITWIPYEVEEDEEDAEDAEELLPDVPVKEKIEHRKRFRFIPKESGFYAFWVHNPHGCGEAWIEGIEGAMDRWDGNCHIFYGWLNAEEVYYCFVEVGEDQSDDLTEFGICKTPELDSVELQEKTLALCVGDRKWISAAYTPKLGHPGDVVWSSDDESVVQVYANGSGCAVEGIAAGMATVTAELPNGMKVSCVVYVKEPVQLFLDTPEMVELNSFGEYFVFIPEYDGYYSFTVDTDKYIDIFVSNEDTGFGVSNFAGRGELRLQCPLQAGILYRVYVVDHESNETEQTTIVVQERPHVIGMKIIDKPHKLSYIRGYMHDGFDPSGLSVELTWSDGTVTVCNDILNEVYPTIDITWEEHDDQTGAVTLGCYGVNASFDVELTENPVKSIRIIDDGFKLPANTYGWETHEGWWYYPTGVLYSSMGVSEHKLRLKINYTDGTSKIVPFESSVDGYCIQIEDPQWTEHWSVGGENKVCISYLGADTECNVTIAENPMESMEVISFCEELVIGEDITYDEYGKIEWVSAASLYNHLVVRLHYKDGTIEDVNCGELLAAQGGAVKDQFLYWNGWPIALDISAEDSEEITIRGGYVSTSSEFSSVIVKENIDHVVKEEVTVNAVTEAIQASEDGKVELTTDKAAISIDADAVSVLKETEGSIEMVVELNNGVTVELNETLVDVLLDQGEEAKPITIYVEPVPVDMLNEEQNAILKDAEVAVALSAKLFCGEDVVGDFQGGAVEVKIPFTVGDGENADEYRTYFIANNGEMIEVDAVYDEAGFMCFTLEHFSEYVIVREKTHLPGDINGDGKVNNKDATRLFQYLANWDVEVVEAALDVNGDGKINNKDATRLFQYLASWNVEIF